MCSQEKVVYANTNVGQHVHFHDHTYRPSSRRTQVSTIVSGVSPERVEFPLE